MPEANTVLAQTICHDFRVNERGEDMSDAPDQRLLEALLDSWDRNQRCGSNPAGKIAGLKCKGLSVSAAACDSFVSDNSV
jgi:hypothetical protein